MYDLLATPSPVSQGLRLNLEAYNKDFNERDFAVDGWDSWKLERQQNFREPGDASWEAFARGDWAEALRLIEARRGELVELSELAERHRCRLLRVRVVEWPLTPYLRWELELLRVRAECGELIRVVGPEKLGSYEQQRPVPELITLNDDTVYEICYDDQGVLEGAVRHLGPRTRAQVAACIEALYDQGEDIATYFAREVAPLPSPAGA